MRCSFCTMNYLYMFEICYYILKHRFTLHTIYNGKDFVSDFFSILTETKISMIFLKTWEYFFLIP